MQIDGAHPVWKIAVEEHVMLPDRPGSEWLETMDRLGIERMLLSPGGTGVQAEVDPGRAVEAAIASNDVLARIVAERPDRFSALAVLPLQDPTAAVAELERAVGQLGTCGVMVNGFTTLGAPDIGHYYDERHYEDVWARVEALGIPFYLHPRDPLPSQRRAYDGRPELLGAAWAFGAETAVHALRLITSGLFDRFPDLTVVLGHLGETLPFGISRTAERLRKADLGLAKPIDAYFRDHFCVTTSGYFHTPALRLAIEELGAERVMFALDHPFADADEGAAWFDGVELSLDDRTRIGRTNAERVFGLQPADHHDRPVGAALTAQGGS
jgi:predicted TIM-barrel fold metal-dependent hydrolase